MHFLHLFSKRRLLVVRKYVQQSLYFLKLGVGDFDLSWSSFLIIFLPPGPRKYSWYTFLLELESIPGP